MCKACGATWRVRFSWGKPHRFSRFKPRPDGTQLVRDYSDECPKCAQHWTGRWNVLDQLRLRK
jgi:hypothetical protein